MVQDDITKTVQWKSYLSVHMIVSQCEHETETMTHWRKRYLVASEGQIQGLLTGQVGSRRVVWNIIVIIRIHRHWQSVVRPRLCHRLQGTGQIRSDTNYETSKETHTSTFWQITASPSSSAGLLTLGVSRLWTRVDGLWCVWWRLWMVRQRLWWWPVVLSLQERVMVFWARRTVSWLKLRSRHRSHLCRLWEHESSRRSPAARNNGYRRYHKVIISNTIMKARETFPEKKKRVVPVSTDADWGDLWMTL